MDCKVLEDAKRKTCGIGILVIKRAKSSKKSFIGCGCEGCRSGKPRVIDENAHRRFVKNIFEVVEDCSC